MMVLETIEQVWICTNDIDTHKEKSCAPQPMPGRR
jgi:hypothetical protein